MDGNKGAKEQLVVSRSEANGGAWSFHENLSYAIFIDVHKKSMTSKKKMREMNFFDKLSIFVTTRTSSQCRSHHQKVFGKFKYISQITAVFKTQLGKDTYALLLKQGRVNLKKVDQLFAQNAQQPPHSPPAPAPDHQQKVDSPPLASLEHQGLDNLPLQPNEAAGSKVPPEGSEGGPLWMNWGEAKLPFMPSSYFT